MGFVGDRGTITTWLALERCLTLIGGGEFLLSPPHPLCQSVPFPFPCEKSVRVCMGDCVCLHMCKRGGQRSAMDLTVHFWNKKQQGFSFLSPITLEPDSVDV